jgi:hypothetical protein
MVMMMMLFDIMKMEQTQSEGGNFQDEAGGKKEYQLLITQLIYNCKCKYNKLGNWISCLK